MQTFSNCLTTTFATYNKKVAENNHKYTGDKEGDAYIIDKTFLISKC